MRPTEGTVSNNAQLAARKRPASAYLMGSNGNNNILAEERNTSRPPKRPPSSKRRIIPTPIVRPKGRKSSMTMEEAREPSLVDDSSGTISYTVRNRDLNKNNNKRSLFKDGGEGRDTSADERETESDILQILGASDHHDDYFYSDGVGGGEESDRGNDADDDGGDYDDERYDQQQLDDSDHKDRMRYGIAGTDREYNNIKQSLLAKNAHNRANSLLEQHRKRINWMNSNGIESGGGNENNNGSDNRRARSESDNGKMNIISVSDAPLPHEPKLQKPYFGERTKLRARLNLPQTNPVPVRIGSESQRDSRQYQQHDNGQININMTSASSSQRQLLLTSAYAPGVLSRKNLIRNEIATVKRSDQSSSKMNKLLDQNNTSASPRNEVLKQQPLDSSQRIMLVGSSNKRSSQIIRSQNDTPLRSGTRMMSYQGRSPLAGNNSNNNHNVDYQQLKRSVSDFTNVSLQKLNPAVLF